jgi:carboxypeptidase C (cathepsin A)
MKKILYSICISLSLSSALLAVNTNAAPVAPTEAENEKHHHKHNPVIKSSLDVVRKAHVLDIKNKTLSYESVTGTLIIKNDEGKDNASIFFTGYFLKDSPASNRPITFCFNGGPGASSIWLHMGVLGPKKVAIKDLQFNASPGHYQDNPHTLLEETDLVFVDPVSTGYSKPAEGIEAKEFYGVEEDISSLSEFVRQFVTHFDRWGSPKFLLGESYGTLRVVGIGEKLAEDNFLFLNGLILISSCLDLQTSDNDLGYILALPSFSAASWYHKKLSPELQSKKLQELLAEVEEFATHEYATALLLGDSLEDTEKRKVTEKLASFTGFSVDYVLKSSLRIRDIKFFKELLENQAKLVGRFDARFTGPEADPLSQYPSYDPSLSAVSGAFTSAFQEYLRDNLGYKKDDSYEVLTPLQQWNWGLKNQAAGLGYLSVSNHLKSSMIKNPALKLFMASGYYDLATPYFATDYTVNHLQLPPELRQNLQQHYYEAGHMMYLHEPSLIRLKKDLSEYYQTAVPKQP